MVEREERPRSTAGDPVPPTGPGGSGTPPAGAPEPETYAALLAELGTLLDAHEPREGGEPRDEEREGGLPGPGHPHPPGPPAAPAPQAAGGGRQGRRPGRQDQLRSAYGCGGSRYPRSFRRASDGRRPRRVGVDGICFDPGP